LDEILLAPLAAIGYSAHVAVPAALRRFRPGRPSPHHHPANELPLCATAARAGRRGLGLAFVIQALTTLAQSTTFIFTHSSALMSDLVHNVSDMAVIAPVTIGVLLARDVLERLAGIVVVVAVLASATGALWIAFDRLGDPRPVERAWALALAGAVGVAGNWCAAGVLMTAGRRLGSSALVATGHHARADAYASLGVVAGALAAGVGLPPSVDPAIAAVIAGAILHTARDAVHAVRARG
jgi:divalent metal cation (Fe/Co/Zn/Cd) transporter